MKRFSKSMLLMLTSALFTVQATSQNLDWNITGAGARAEGFGGAFIGVADDATSVVWNPAGLATLERPEASLVTRYISEKTDFSYQPDPTFNTSENQSHFSLNFGSFAYPLKSGGNNIVLAVAFQRQLDFYANVNDKYSHYESSGGANTITPGVGVQITPLIALGAAANFWMNKFEYSSFDVVTSRQNFASSGTFSGTNFVFGALIDFSAMNPRFPLKLGVSMKTAFDLETDVTGKYLTSGASQALTWTVQMPSMVGFGASYPLTENLIVAADYEARFYRGRSFSVAYSDGTLGGNYNVTESNDNLNQLRIGAEYLIVSQAGVFPVRVGFRTVPTVMANYSIFYDALSNSYFAGSPTGQVVGSGFSIGTGYIAQRFAIDVTYNHTAYTQTYGSYYSYDYSISTVSTSLIVYF